MENYYEVIGRITLWFCAIVGGVSFMYAGITILFNKSKALFLFGKNVIRYVLNKSDFEEWQKSIGVCRFYMNGSDTSDHCANCGKKEIEHLR